MKTTSPSRLFQLLCWGVRTRKLTRGYHLLLRSVPKWVWGGENLQIDTECGPMVLSLEDIGSSGILLWGYMPNEIREAATIKRLAIHCHVMLDIGAHVGWYTRLMWQAMMDGIPPNQECQVIAFEPNPETYPYLQENTFEFPGIRIVQAIVADTEGLGTFYCSTSSDLSSSTRPVGRPVTVQRTTLDTFLKQGNLLDQVDFVKCDVEGGEYHVLLGARAMREAANPPIWMIEVSETFLKEAGISVGDFLEEIQLGKAGTRLYTLTEEGAQEIISFGDRQNMNNLFLVPERRQAQFWDAVSR